MPVEPSASSDQTAVYDDVAEYAEIGTINESKSRQAVTIATTSAAEEKVAPGQVVAVMCVCKIIYFLSNTRQRWRSPLHLDVKRLRFKHKFEVS